MRLLQKECGKCLRHSFLWIVCITFGLFQFLSIYTYVGNAGMRKELRQMHVAGLTILCPGTACPAISNPDRIIAMHPGSRCPKRVSSEVWRTLSGYQSGRQGTRVRRFGIGRRTRESNALTASLLVAS